MLEPICMPLSSSLEMARSNSSAAPSGRLHRPRGDAVETPRIIPDVLGDLVDLHDAGLPW
jgi:hypothetical protein